MRVFKSLNRRSLNYTKNSVLIIGNLDGVHKGHQSIINSAKKIVNKQKTKSLLFQVIKKTIIFNTMLTINNLIPHHQH